MVAARRLSRLGSWFPRFPYVRTVDMLVRASSDAAAAWNSCCRYYSMYGHVETLAREIQKGANSVEGVEATLYQVSTADCALVLLFVDSKP